MTFIIYYLHKINYCKLKIFGYIKIFTINLKVKMNKKKLFNKYVVQQ
jgi:hypothetical protein